MSKPILCLDFDGVIHSYTSGWQGITIVADPPVPGALEFIQKTLYHCRVAIFSTRSAQSAGIFAMQTWLRTHAILMLRKKEEPGWLEEIEWPVTKPLAFLTIDDRALTFTGEWPTIQDILDFRPWNKK